MGYRVKPDAEYWNSGVFCVPKVICEKHLKFATELQLKVLLLLLSDGGCAEPEELEKALGADSYDILECLEFWVYEGILVKDGEKDDAPVQAEAAAPEKVPDKKAFEALPVPNLTPRDIVVICSEDKELADLLRTAEKILSSSLSNAMKSNIVNMVTYYGLPVSVVVTLLEYYRDGRENGKNVTTRTIQNMAKDWAYEGINSLELASAKLQEMCAADDRWNSILEKCEFDYRKPTNAQLKMMARWNADFDDEMIAFACNTMRKNNPKEEQSIKIIDNILKTWKRKGFKTPEDVKSQPEKKAEPTKKGKLKSKPTFDIEEFQRQAELNDSFDF